VPSLWDHLSPQLTALLGAAGLRGRLREALELSRKLGDSWSARPIAARPSWSGVTDDCTPVELSLAISASAPEVRVLVEPQAQPASPVAYWRAGNALVEWLGDHQAADITPFRRISGLFEPRTGGPPVYWSLWLAASFCGDGLFFKVYLNPQANDRPAREVCREAMARSNVAAGWEPVARALRPSDELLFVGLDLLPADRRRFKVYVRPRSEGADDLERLCSLAPGHRAGDARAFFERTAGTSSGRPPVVALHFCGDQAEPVRAVPQIALSDSSFDNLGTRDKVRTLLADYGLPHDQYCESVDALLARSTAAHGLHSWISWQQDHRGPRITVYFNPCAYLARYGPIAVAPTRTWSE
jgi:hypothetical protein